MTESKPPRYQVNDQFTLKDDPVCVVTCIGILENVPMLGRYRYKLKYPSGSIKYYTRNQIRKIMKPYVLYDA